jgi:hypothetical protein
MVMSARRSPADEAAHHVVREELQQEERMVRGEDVARDLADAPAVLELGDRGLDLGAAVVNDES